MQAQTAAAMAQADAVLVSHRRARRRHAGGSRFRRSGAPLRQAGDPGRQQERRPRRRSRRARGLCARPRRAGRDQRRAWRGPGRPLRCVARCACRTPRRSPSTRRSPLMPLDRQANPHRRCRPAEHRQIDADQPPARRGAAADRARGRASRATRSPSTSHWRGRRFRIHDTAGLRRRARIDEKLEKLSVADALNAIRFAEVVIVLIDAQTPFEEQDIRIADLVEREGRAIVIAINKWDLIEPRARRAVAAARGDRSHAAADQGRAGRRRCRRSSGARSRPI